MRRFGSADISQLGALAWLIGVCLVAANPGAARSAVLARGEALGAAPSPDLAIPPGRWAAAAAHNEEIIVGYDTDVLLRYRVRKLDAKGEIVREVVESKEGSVARLVQRNGQPLTTDEDKAERERLQSMLDTPAASLRRMRREQGSQTYAVELLRSMPEAMLWSYVPGQPQLPGAPGPAVVLDFKPDPNFKPNSLITEGLTGIAGRIWVDAATQCVTRIQGTILHPVDFGWGGVLARIKEGGYIEMEQRKINDRRWLYSHLIERITVREVLIRTVEENNELSASDVHPLPAPLSFQAAIQQLLALPVPTR